MMNCVRCFTLLLTCGLTTNGLSGGEAIPVGDPDRSTPVSFEQEILPILRNNCLACHSATEKQGDLVLESPQAMIKGGDTGPALVPGKGADSLLLKLASHADEPVMPPQDNDVAARYLTSAELGLIQLWINQGARGSGGVATLSPKSWQPLAAGIHPVLAVSLSSDGRFLACSRGNRVELYHVSTGQLVTQMTDPELPATSGAATSIAHRDLVQSLAFNPDGDLLASGGFREVKLWRRPRDVQQQNIAAGIAVRTMQVSPDRKWIATNGADHSVQLWNAADGTVAQRFAGHTDEVTGLRFSSDGSHLFSCSLDQTVLIWDVNDSELIGQIDVPSPINDVELVPVQATTEQVPHPPVQVVTAGADNAVRVFSFGDQPIGDTQLREAEQVVEIKNHSQPVTCLATVPLRPKEVLSGSRDATMRWWRTADGAQLRQFNHGGAVTSITAAPDGQTLASGGENNSAKLWRASNGQQIAEMKGDIRLKTNVKRVKQQLTSADSRVNVVKRQLDEAEKDIPKKSEAEKKLAEALTKANQDAKEKQTALDTARQEKIKAEQAAVAAAAQVRSLQAAKDAAQNAVDQAAEDVKQAQARATQLQQAAAVAPGNEQLKKLLTEAQAAIQTAQQIVQQKTAAVQEPTKKLQAATSAAAEAAKLVTQAQKPFNDAAAALVKAADAQNLIAQQHALATTELKQSQDLVPLRKQAVAKAEAWQKTVQEQHKQAEETARAAEQPVQTVTFSPDGKTLLTGGNFRVLHAWDAETGAEVGSYGGHQGTITASVFVDALTILSAAEDQTLRIWEANPAWRLERTIGSTQDPTLISHRVTAVDFSIDSQRLLVGGGIPSRSGELLVFSVTDGSRLLHVAEAHDDVVYAAAFSPDATRIASAGADKYLRVFDAASGNQLRRFEGHTGYVLGVAWKGDGQTLATAAADNTIKIWDAETGDQRRTVSNFRKHVTDLHFLGETDDVICVSGDRSTRLVRTTNGGTIRNFSGPTTWMHCTDITRDGTIAVAGDARGDVYIWNATNGQRLHTLTVTQPTESE